MIAFLHPRQGLLEVAASSLYVKSLKAIALHQSILAGLPWFLDFVRIGGFCASSIHTGNRPLISLRHLRLLLRSLPFGI